MTLGPALLAAALGSAPTVDVYTMGQDSDLFERFGHAAICVTRAEGTRCYNYGTTDFASPPEELGWRFLRGDAKFWVSVWPLPRMLEVYRQHDRTVWRQRLPLSAAEARAVAARLEHDALPANRYYRYHHFDDNCSTRVRDVIDEGTAGRLSADGRRSLAASFRTLGKERLAGERVPLLFGDLLVGRRADQVVDVHDGMFLPDVLRAEITRRFGVAPRVVYQRQGPAFPKDPGSNVPYFVVPGLALGALAAALGQRRWARALVGIALGLLALTVWGVALVSSVRELRFNELALVLWPTDFALAFLGLERARRYARLRLIALSLCALLSAVGALLQPVLPIIVLAGLPLFFVAFAGYPWRASSRTDATA